ncbi:MAG: n-acetylglutamate synthase [Candidatus Eremiobacteraeota bacterium]|nr:n-acetylglutamate synthase [Candidatus Eremiobacteraeota bacterium]
MINYEGRRFSPVVVGGSGEVSAATIFEYHQSGRIVWAQYSGGSIKMGTLLANVSEDGSLDMVYQQINDQGELRTGKCISTPSILEDGRIRLQERWQWTNGDLSRGDSTVDEL